MEMDKQKAAAVIGALLQQAMGAGMFRTFQELDLARQALQVLSSDLKDDGDAKSDAE
jgi:hypothetical protein